MADAGSMPSNSTEVNNPLVSKIQMSPTWSLILACLVFSLMVLVFAYLRRMGRINSLHGATGFRFMRRRPDTHRGLDPAIIESFPVFVYSDVKALKLDRKNEMQLECAVCLHEFEDEETLRLLPQCCHVFHPDCIDAWLAFRATCPLCRCDLKTNPNELPTSILDSTDQVNPSSVPLQGGGNDTTIIDIQEVNTSPSVQTTHVPNKTPRKKTPYSTPRRPRILGMFTRSHSTGHSLVQTSEDRERFTLRLPKDVQKRLVDLNLSRSGNNTPFTPERSSAKGYRCKSYKEQFGKPRLLATPPMNFITCGSSSKEVKSEKHQKFVKSIKSPLSLFFKSRKDDDVGERSFAYLRSNPSI